jgi:hypothetical protein
MSVANMINKVCDDFVSSLLRSTVFCDEFLYENFMLLVGVQGYIKGYISHEASTVVLSPKQPFPPLRSVV